MTPHPSKHRYHPVVEEEQSSAMEVAIVIITNRNRISAIFNLSEFL